MKGPGKRFPLRGKPALELSPALRNALVFSGWIAGILLAASLVWFLTRPVREGILVQTVNRILTEKEAGQIAGLIPSPALSSRIARLGTWFTMSGPSGNQDRLLIFSFMADGFFFPCAAVISPPGKVSRIIPLNPHGEKLLNYFAPGVIAFYIKRIERGINPDASPAGGGRD